MTNPFYMLEKRNRRLWALAVAIPFLIATIILLPISIIWDLVCDIPRILCNLWNDMRRNFVEPVKYIGRTWAYWWEAVSGKADREARRQEEVMATYDSSPIEAIEMEVQ